MVREKNEKDINNRKKDINNTTINEGKMKWEMKLKDEEMTKKKGKMEGKDQGLNIPYLRHFQLYLELLLLKRTKSAFVVDSLCIKTCAIIKK